MGLTPTLCTRLVDEGLGNIEDFDDFKIDQLEMALKNMRTPIPGVPSVRKVSPEVPGIPPCIVSAKYALRLEVASNA